MHPMSSVVLLRTAGRRATVAFLVPSSSRAALRPQQKSRALLSTRAIIGGFVDRLFFYVYNTASTTTTPTRRTTPPQQQQQHACIATLSTKHNNNTLEEAKEATTTSATTTTIQEPSPPSLLSASVAAIVDFESDADETSSFRYYKPQQVMDELHQACIWKHKKEWDPTFIRQAVDGYEHHLIYIWNHLQQQQQQQQQDQQHSLFQLESFLPSHQIQPTRDLLSSKMTERAFKASIKMKIHTSELSRRVRELERLIGSIGMTPITDELSRRLVEANGKAGNVGRVLALLNLRKARNYPPTRQEFRFAIRAITSAGLFLRQYRNVFVGDRYQPAIDNPTRWLDAILLNMHQRQFELDLRLANNMLNTYATAGKSGKAIHFFYKVVRTPVLDPMQLKEQDVVDEFDMESVQLLDPNNDNDKQQQQQQQLMPIFRKRRIRVKMKMRSPPPYHKIPSQAKGLVAAAKQTNSEKCGGQSTERVSKLQIESELDWSLPLTAAFAFADSLRHGACGHAPLELDITSWNILIKACCHRGALWRAFSILNDVLPRQQQHGGMQPNIYTYNTILAGLARVGDVSTMEELLITMTNKGTVKPDAFTVQAMVDGLCNVGNVAKAISLVQDMFNQHSVVPPYTIHLKILEFALANELIHEAKRHVYFIQQLWKWKPTPNNSDAEFIRIMELTQRNPKLSKEALKKLFAFFGERLEEKDFL